MKREEVEVKVLEQGGLFKKAKVLLVWGEEIAKDEQPEQEETVTSTEQQVEETSEEVIPEVKEEKKKRVYDTTRIQEKGKEFLLGLANLVGENATCEVSANENEVSFALHGDKLGKLIGYHGENLQALQMLLSGIKAKGEGGIRLYIDVDGYKANRNQAIIELANKTADQAVKIERNIHLDPMNAYERRIIHTTLQERDDVTTESTGEGEKRHVVVKPIF